MVRTEVQNLATGPSPIFAKPQLWRNRGGGTPSCGISGFIPGWGSRKGDRGHFPSDHPGVTCYQQHEVRKHLAGGTVMPAKGDPWRPPILTPTGTRVL